MLIGLEHSARVPPFQAVLYREDQRVYVNRLPKDAREVLDIQIACIAAGNDDDRDLCGVGMGRELTLHIAASEARYQRSTRAARRQRG